MVFRLCTGLLEGPDSVAPSRALLTRMFSFGVADGLLVGMTMGKPVTCLVVWVDENGTERARTFHLLEEAARPPNLAERGREVARYSRHGLDELCCVGVSTAGVTCRWEPGDPPDSELPLG